MAWFTAEYLAREFRYEYETRAKPYNCERPVNYRSDTIRHRLWLAWQVFTGRMDAVKWYKQ